MQIQFGSTHKYAKFGRGSVVLESRTGDPLDLGVIAKNCPAVFAEDKHSSRSARYTYVSTFNVLEGLAKEGFHPHSVMQGGSKDEEKRGFTKHLIRFRQSGSIFRPNGTTYEIVLLGSHDGTTSYQMFGGFYRSLCKNGSIWFDGQAAKVVIPHKGDIIPQVIEGAYTVLNQRQLAYDHVDNFQSIQLNRGEQLAFAAAANVARFGDESPAPVQPLALLVPRRVDDQANDLWTTFNRVQENVIRGGLGFVQEQRRQDGTTRAVHRSTAPIRSVDGDVRLNRALWTLAAELAKIKSAG